MASSPDFVTLVAEACRLAGQITTRKMFGEYALYLDGILVGLICDNRLFVKSTEAGRVLLGNPTEAPPYPGAKTAFVIEHQLDDRDFLRRLLQASRDELGAAKKPSPRKPPSKKSSLPKTEAPDRTCTPRLEPGQPAPALDIPDQDGTLVHLPDWRGRWLVVYFYPKDNTPGCTLEGQAFSQLSGDFSALGVEILGISGDSPASHCRFRSSKGITLRLLSDIGHTIQERWGVWQKKVNYGKEYMGTVRSTFLVNPDGMIAHVWSNVKVAGHATAVLSKIRELRAIEH
mgnify:FL=1